MLKPSAESQTAAFSEVAVQHLDALYRYAMSLTHNEAEAEDLVQETYLRALRASGRLRPDSNIKSWLFTILRNLRLNEVQRPGFRSQTRDFEEASGSLVEAAGISADNPHSAFVSATRAEDVRRAVADLSPAHREIIVLREFEDLSYEEIGEILNCRPGTVMSRLARAREKLKEMLCSWDQRRHGSAPLPEDAA